MKDPLPNYVPEIKRALTDVRRLCDALGFTANTRSFSKQAGGLMVRCPVHDDRGPSCSVQLRGDEVLWKCHSCDVGGDVLSLIAAVRGLSLQGSGFREVLIEAAQLGGLHSIVDALEGRGPRPEPRPLPPVHHDPVPDRDYPPQREVDDLWASCHGVTDDATVAALLAGRAISPEAVEGLDLARALPEAGTLPRWAVCQGGTWRDAGYKLVIPMYDAGGTMRSVRAWRVVDGDGPKRRPPFGHKASGLCMLDPFALSLVRGERKNIERVVIVEGEPDLLSRATVSNDPRLATYGIVSGSWSDAWSDTVPEGTRVVVRTDHDPAGDRYMTQCFESIRSRRFGCLVLRGEA